MARIPIAFTTSQRARLTAAIRVGDTSWPSRAYGKAKRCRSCEVSEITARNSAETGLKNQTILGKVALHSQLWCFSRVGQWGTWAVEGHHVGTDPKTDGIDRAGCHASRVEH